MPALLVALILLFTAAAPIAAPVAERTIVVRGVVKDSTSGAAIAGAQVAISARGSTTPSRAVSASGTGAFLGRITVADTTKLVVVQARALGYGPVTAMRPIAGDTITVNFALVPQHQKLDEVVVTGVLTEVYGSRAANSAVSVKMRGAAGLGSPAAPAALARSFDPRWNTEEYAKIDESRFVSVASSPLSTFSVDVDRASYTNVRRFINQGAMPPKDAVRIEELINYFSYAYSEPTGRHPVSITTNVAAAPWNATHRIVRIGLQTKRIRTEKLPPSNLVFLIDVSGSMHPANKLPLVKQAFRLLVNELREQDRVAIVVYAGAAGLVLPSTPASEKQTILDAIDRLEAGGSTAGGEGIKLAYDVAKKNFLAEGNNRVILATDGDFNIGISSTSEMVRLIEERRAEGAYLTVLGFGMGNIKDARLEQLADKGNGNYAYIDDLLEARKMLVQEMGATLLTVAKDVKLQIEFNPAAVQAYRLIGYENRLLANQDFTNDKKDAGDMGAGHSVTALYEVIPVGVKLDVAMGTTDTLRYQRPTVTKPQAGSSELLFVNLRYKPPTDTVSRLMQHAVVDTKRAPAADFRFQMALAGYGMLLRDSEFKGTLKWDDVLALARSGAEDDKYRSDFILLVENTRRIAAGVASNR